MKSGSANEADRRFCIAIKATCPTTTLPLRIADARPRLNANANAIQGKGFENITALGGPRAATLVFLDIENIHVMRSSFAKLKEGIVCPTMTSGSGGGFTSSSDSSSDAVSSSKWLYHVAGVIRGSLGIAESLVLGHPVLTHCSDGWYEPYNIFPFVVMNASQGSNSSTHSNLAITLGSVLSNGPRILHSDGQGVLVLRS